MLHLAAQHGMTQLTELLIKTKEEDGFGANINIADLIEQRAIHYAI